MQIKKLDLEARNSLATIIKRTKKVCRYQPKHILFSLIKSMLINWRLKILREQNLKDKFISLIESEKMIENYNRIVDKWEKKTKKK